MNGNKTNKEKVMRGGKHGAEPHAVQRGRLRAAALSRRRKLRFSVGLLSQPARFAPLRSWRHQGKVPPSGTDFALIKQNP